MGVFRGRGRERERGRLLMVVKEAGWVDMGREREEERREMVYGFKFRMKSQVLFVTHVLQMTNIK